jgi:hypothetical protein
MPRRNEQGWRDLGPLTWKVEREDNHGDCSTSTRISLTWTRRWSFDMEFTRPWKDAGE